MKSDSLYYIHKDYQGNMETITDENGVVLEKLSFDLWGRRRDSGTWMYKPNLKPKYFDRGYTMHEHLFIFGLINMNGRLYDPWVGRMLSPDPFVQNPSNLQNYNRYRYALNNPLKYTDPSGYMVQGYWDEMRRTHASLNSPNPFAFGLTRYTGDLVSGFGTSSTSYSYSESSGNYFDRKGNIVGFSEVFSNFVEPNSLVLPSNTDLYSISAKGDGYSFCTIDPTSSPLWSSSNTELNLHFALFGGSTGGRDNLMIDQIGPSSNKYYEPSIMELIIHNQARQGLSFALGLESTMISIAAHGNWAKTVLQVAKGTNYTGAVFGMADNYLNAQLATTQGKTTRAYFEYGQMALYGVSAGMLESRKLAPIGGTIIFGLGLIDLGQYWHDNN